MPATGPVPTATYRLQLRQGLTLERIAEQWLEPLAELGVSHLYLSPPFVATDGSTHGYDVVDPTRVDPVIGGDEAFAALAEAAHERGLGIVVDLVPNHVAIDHDRNEAWWDLLRNGPASVWATMFDLDWAPPEPRLRGQLLLPVLPDHYGRELEARRFRLEVARGEIRVWHPSVHCPIEPASSAPIVAEAAKEADDVRLADLAEELAALPDWSAQLSVDELARRRTAEPELRDRFADLLADPANRDALQRRLDAWTADLEVLDGLIAAQPYRPARWQTAREDLGYRRFFDVNTLIGVRVDRPEVFDLTHRLVAEWVERGLVDGLRIDHVDGLRWPATYLDRLRDLAPGRWIVVEKIVEGDEELPPWPVAGTTGYEVAELIDRLDLDERGRPVLERLARDAGAPTDIERTIESAKREALDELLSADLNRLTELLLQVCESRRRFRDVTRRELHDALAATVTHLPVYRAYLEPGRPNRAEDEAVTRSALAAARAEAHDADPEIFELLDLLVVEGRCATEAEWDFVARFQQLCSPVTAKGIEDTAWFRLATLVSRCEVGASADRWSIDLVAFHRATRHRFDRWPDAMTSTSTHDTKRSEDVRARLAVLSQRSDEWDDVARRWMATAGAAAPDGALALQALQTLVGAWPLDEQRLGKHLLKVAREAKVVTSWLRPDAALEDALARWTAELFATPDWLEPVEEWVRRTEPDWRRTVLAHKALALTLPGVPDVYQGSEELLLTLTDPDNRDPVDPSRLRSQLQELRTVGPVPGDHPLAKTALVLAALDLRRRRPECFGATGGYEPLWAAGPRSDHVVAFRRGADVVVVAARLVAGLDDGWQHTRLDLPDGGWIPLLGDGPDDGGGEVTGTVDVGDLLGSWPVSLLERAR